MEIPIIKKEIQNEGKKGKERRIKSEIENGA